MRSSNVIKLNAHNVDIYTELEDTRPLKPATDLDCERRAMHIGLSPIAFFCMTTFRNLWLNFDV